MTTVRKRAGTVALGIVAAASLVFTGIAIAGNAPPINHGGGALTQTRIATGQTPLVTTDEASGWTDLSATQLSFTVPQGRERLVVATLTAETFCTAANFESWCAARIVAKRSGGTVQELRPVTGSDFALDSGGGDGWEGHTITRSRRLGAGTWKVWVQTQMMGSGFLTIDDWHFQADIHK